jgi:hypothetical protein
LRRTCAEPSENYDPKYGELAGCISIFVPLANGMGESYRPERREYAQQLTDDSEAQAPRQPLASAPIADLIIMVSELDRVGLLLFRDAPCS